MAEGFSHIPSDETAGMPPERPDVMIPARRTGIKGFLDTIRLNMLQSRENKEDDDEDEKKKGRFGRLLSRVFGGIVGKEDVPADGQERRGLFFDIAEPVPTTEAPTAERSELSPGDLRVDSTLESKPVIKVQKDAEPTKIPDLESGSADSGELEDLSTEAPKVEEAIPEAVDSDNEPSSEPTPEPVPYRAETGAAPDKKIETVYVQRGMRPETVATLGAYEHHRVSKLKKRESELEKNVDKLQKKIEKIEKTPNKQPEIVYERKTEPAAEKKSPVITSEKFMPKIKTERSPEQKRTITSETTREQQRSAVEKAVEKHNKELSSEKKQEVIERILAAPEFKGALNSEVTKDIAYEMSHESKDMDSQSQSAWAALQAAADDTAKANAKALAEASKQISTANEGDALRKAVAQQTADQKALYKKAAFSGFMTAIILVAILFIILLMQRS